MSDLEVFPHKRNWVATNFQTGHVNRGVTPYRFVEIVTALGWRCYPGQQCHEGKDGLLIEDSPARWEEQDLWGAHNGDYTLDMGMRWTRGERELDHARAEIALASRAAELEPPLDTVFIHLGELEALRASADLARDLGF